MWFYCSSYQKNLANVMCEWQGPDSNSEASQRAEKCVCVRALSWRAGIPLIFTTAHYLNFTNEKQAERGSDLPMATKPGACFLVPTIVFLGNKWPADG